MSDVSFEEITLAGLFHDIGKPLQRAGRGLDNKAMSGQWCPTSQQGTPTHLHVLHTDMFIRGHVKMFPQGVRPQTVATVAAAHHRPTSSHEHLIKWADWASAGADRIKGDVLEKDTQYFEKPLRSVFSGVHTGDDREPMDPSPDHMYPLGVLAPENWMKKGIERVTREQYERLCTGFERDLECFEHVVSFDHFCRAVDATMQHHLWCVPANTMDGHDVSLYDHSVTTAAFAAVIFRFMEQTGEPLQQLRDDQWFRDQRPFLLVNGDISGIQRYIFDIRSHKASAKVLRARSFELQQLTDAVGSELLRRCELPRWCRLFSSAGRVWWVLPNTVHTRSVIHEMRSTIERYMIDEFIGQLSFQVSEGVEAGIDQLSASTFRLLFDQARYDGTQAKQRRFQVGLRDVGHVLAPISDPEHGVCVSCGVRPATEHQLGENTLLCRHCNALVELGRSLPTAKFASRTETQSVLFDGIRVGTSPEGSSYSLNAYNPTYGLIRTGTHQPVGDDGQTADFSDLARSSRGAPYLAMLKADVDRLGRVFSRGLGNRLTVSRYATLSRMMDLFFTAHLQHIMDHATYAHVYPVFSGGDDLCVIGPWNVVLDLAQEIKTQFLSYVGNRSGITISMGISLEHPNIPVRQMNSRAEAELDRAKEERNRVSVFGGALEWPEFEYAVQEGMWLAEQVSQAAGSSNGPSTGAVYRLLHLHRLHEECLSQSSSRRVEALGWRGAFRYHLTRNWPDDDEKKERVIRLMEEHPIAVPLVVSYALYANRVQLKGEERA